MGTTHPREGAIRLDRMTKRFGPVVAVRDVSMDIREGEFLTLLGPSGCGKTTTLRIIAGFEDPDEGDIFLRGENVWGVPPNLRNVNMVFQQYALFPHMSVYDNVAFGLRLKKVPPDERRTRVAEMLEVVRMQGMDQRRPQQLSGGQQQRVALARALVNRPAALLLDEPLGALDVKLRKQMQLELKRIQHELGTTFVYVTHDQEEALSMSDRIAVMNQGVVEQVGSPRDVYEYPATEFVADFVGLLNTVEGPVDEVREGLAIIKLGLRDRVVVRVGDGAHIGDRLSVSVRPERTEIRPVGVPAPERGSRLEATVSRVVYLGSLTQFHVQTRAGASLVAHRLSDDDAAQLEEGSPVVVSWNEDHSLVLG